MSGLCAVVHRDGRGVPDSGLLEGMMSVVEFRGRTGRGVWRGPGAALGALHGPSDPPTDGPAPRPDPRSGLVVAADARLDGRVELLAALGRDAPPPGRRSVPDLLAAAFDRWGAGCVPRLLGDWAFVVWDPRDRRLFAARDVLGMRTLHYRVEPDRVLLATEAVQLLSVGVSDALFEPAVAAHLSGPFGSPEWSFHDGIRQLAPGHALLVEDGAVRTWRCTRLRPDRSLPPRHEEEAAESLLEVLEAAVADRVEGGCTPGLLLSGGLDSGSVASVAGHLAERGTLPSPPLRTFSWAFEELPSCDERDVSRRIARRFGLTTVDVPADDAWPLAGFPTHGPDPDDPYLSVYQALHDRTFALARGAGVGLLMGGERGDEVVGDRIWDLPGLLRAGRWRRLMDESRALARATGRPLRRVLRTWLAAPVLVRGYPPFRPDPPPWIRPDFAARTGLRDLLDAVEPPDELDDPARSARLRRVTMQDGIRRAQALERRRARFGLGYADPWSDRRVVERVLALPQWMVHGVEEPKRLLRRAMRGIIPPDALERVGKTEPAALFRRGFRERAVDTVRGLLAEPRSEAMGFVDGEALRAAFEDYLGGRPVRHDFWWPVSLEIWLRTREE